MIFVDTSFFLSLMSKLDHNHGKARELSQKHGDQRLLTTYAVISEIATVGAQRISKKLTVEFLDQLQQDHHIRIVTESSDLMKETWQIFKGIKSKNVSWVDCYTVAVMKKYNVNEILTFDEDFKKIGKSFTIYGAS